MRASIFSVLLFAILIGPSPTAAQEARLRGQQGVVIDESGGVIGAARWQVRSTQGAVLQEADTAADGTFTIDPLPAGTYWLEVTARHFRARRVSIRLDDTQTSPLRVELSLAPMQSDVTVTAQRGMVAEIDRTPPVVSVRDEGDRRGRPLATIGNVLEGATGVMVQQSTYGQVSPFIRGLTGYHVLNLVDGVRFNNSTFRSGPNQYLAFADPSQVERIEVMSGPASSQFGSDALGGAIQLLTPALGFGGAAGRPVAGDATLFGGSADQSIGADAGLFLRGRFASWTIGGARRRLDDLRAGGGTDSRHALRRFFGLGDEELRDVTGDRQIDTGFTQSSFHTKVAARLGAQQNLTLWYQRSAQEDVRGYKDLWGGLGRLRSDFDPQRLQFGYARYERLGVGPLDWVSGTFSVNGQDDGSARQGLRFTDRVVRDDVRVDALGYALQAGARLADRHNLVFGGEIYDESVDARRDETVPQTGVIEQKRPLYPNGSGYRTSGVFIQDVVDLVRGDQGSALTAHLGGRFTRVNVTTDAASNVSDLGQSFGVVDSERSYQDWTFNTGVIWTVNPVLSINALVGRGFRAPNLNDLGALGLNDLGYEIPSESAIASGALIGASDGEGVASTGRPVDSLTSESLFNYELGTTVNWRRVHGRVHVFDAELKDPIVRRTLLFPAANVPSALAGLPVTPIAPTAGQRDQGVVGVATTFDPRAVKAFVNDGRARYRGVDALFRYRVSTRWSAEANYSYLSGHDLDPERPVRRLPPQQGFAALRYQPGGLLSWIEASAAFSGAQEKLSGGDITDERIGASRSRNDITSFFQGGLVRPYIAPGGDGQLGTADDLFGPTGETLAQVRNRVLPIGATINGVTIVDDATRVPLYTQTRGFVSVNLRSSLALTERIDLMLALMNVFDRNYRTHGSGVDAPGLNAFASVRVSY